MYSAPEVGKKLNAHPTSDLYSLGLCLMYLAGGEPSQDWLPPSLDIKVRGFIRCLLEKDRERRPKSAWDELERFKLIRKEVYGESGLVFMDEK
jgi:serine/threonine protein kinase